MATSHDRHPPAGTSVVTSIAASLASQELLAANPDRLGAKIYNDSPSWLLVKLGSSITDSDITDTILPYERYVVEPGSTDAIHGIWLARADGNARITEISP